jgi:hypothetical protein
MTGATAETQPFDTLMGFIVSLLTPFLMTGSITDPVLARHAVAETIAAYRTTGPGRTGTADQLVSIAQVVAFALASLDTLRLSLPPAVSLSMKLKLAGSANALNRAAQRATATLEAQRREIRGPEATRHAADPATPEPATPEPDPADAARAGILAALEAAKTVLRRAPATQPATDRGIDLSWAGAMTDVATEYTAELASLPPDQRRTHLARIGALAEIATALGRGDAPPLKARLLGTSSLHAELASMIRTP